MPRGFGTTGHVLKLKKGLYGLRQSPRLWSAHLTSNLEDIGFEQMKEVDACLFISDRVICVTYVDDTLFFARDMKDIDDVIEKLRTQQNMSLDVEDDLAGFLGVQVKRDTASGKTTMTQAGLTNRIIEALKCKNLPDVDTPADVVLGKDEFGNPATCDFNYASVI